MIHVGTSGYNYPEWRGSFYPVGMARSRMLGYYAERFSTVEINSSFYRLPSERVLRDWAGATPEAFSFTLKAPRRITHDARLRDCQELVALFLQRADVLGPKLGALLFQLPPFARADLGTLETFLGWLPAGLRVAVEFRHSSWWTDEVYALLRHRSVALCVTDTEQSTTPLVETAPHGYLRLRNEGYGPEELARWAETVREQGSWQETYVYFKHERAGTGPAFARELREHLVRRGTAVSDRR